MSLSRTNWHEAITCAIQIDLGEYSQILKYKKEYLLSQNRNRIDFLIIKKNLDIHIPKHIASLFRTHNIFEIKGLSSSLTTDAYYKTKGHAGYYINSYPGNNVLNRRDITLSFPTFKYPRNLFRHLTKDCNKSIAKPFPGVYYINTEMYPTQVLVIDELSPEDSLYLHCLTRNLKDQELINQLTADYSLNTNNQLYTNYMHQFLGFHMKGEQLMVCENLFKLYGTSSTEIAQKAREQATEQAKEQAKELYLPQIEKLTNENIRLKQLLLQNNIDY